MDLLKKGDRVRHSVKAEWGLGEVICDQEGQRVSILFEDVGHPQKFDLAQAKFDRLTGPETESAYLTSMVRSLVKMGRSKPRRELGNEEVLGFESALARFLKCFPLGFQDPAYLEGQLNERKYKDDARSLFLTELSCPQMTQLLESHNYDELWARCSRVMGRTNLIHHYERMWLKNGMADPVNRRTFCICLKELLYGTTDEASRFKWYAEVLQRAGAPRWTVATYFQFLADPHRYIFVKPRATRHAAECIGVDLDLSGGLNWTSYENVLQFANQLDARLKERERPELIPRDMIDVYSFIWVINPAY